MQTPNEISLTKKNKTEKLTKVLYLWMGHHSSTRKSRRLRCLRGLQIKL